MNDNAFVPSRPNDATPIRVLMADPDESLPSMYGASLGEEGFEVVAARSGLECVARFRECVPDVLVLEPQLLWGGGEGVLTIMGESPDLAMVPVMILTSARDSHALNRVASFPISEYHLKPLAPDRLAGRLRAMLRHPRTRFTLAEQTGRLEWVIARRTGDRVRDLHVEAVNGRVIVRGRSDSYHITQLALAAVLEAFEAFPSHSERIELDIDVAPFDHRHSRRCE